MPCLVPVLSYYALSCAALCCPVPPCSARFCSVIFCTNVPCPALPCPALPCPALPCPALPCPALPCPALFCYILCCSSLVLLCLILTWLGLPCSFICHCCEISFSDVNYKFSPTLVRMQTDSDFISFFILGIAKQTNKQTNIIVHDRILSTLSSYIIAVHRKDSPRGRF